MQDAKKFCRKETDPLFTMHISNLFSLEPYFQKYLLTFCGNSALRNPLWQTLIYMGSLQTL